MPGLLPFMENIDHQLLCTNIDFGTRASATTDRCLASVVREMDGHKIGILGYTTTETPVGVTADTAPMLVETWDCEN